MSDPVRLPIERVKKRADPNTKLISMLEGMLESARKGELQAVACACVYANDLEPGGGTSFGLQMAPYTRHAMAFALSEMNHKIGSLLHED